ncbi:MAG: N-acetyltransferase [Eggerthellaceae bacterium]|nr:N-acetyltransferase [Eggerthellaceae bacterium]
MSFFSHETACVDEGAIVGDGTKIWHFSHIQSGAVIGKDCVLGQNVNVAGGAIVGDRCKIQNNVSVYEGVELSDDVFCGPSCVFTNDHQPRAHSSMGWDVSPTKVLHGASIGANATIVCGNTLGEYCMIGSGGVVTHDVPPYALMVGVPARQIGWVCECGAKLDDALSCPMCGKAYTVVEGELKPNDGQ